MTASSPSPETIRFIARILAAQPTAVTEVAETIANIARTVDTLSTAPAPAESAVPGRVAKPEPQVAASRAAEPAAPEPIVLKTRGAAAVRPRRRITVEAEPVEPEVELAPEPAPQPRLLRRAEIVTPEPAPTPALLATRPAAGPARGVVKWFDGKTGKGALRLTGVSGDVAIERAALEQSGIKRLYKDQEIEATVEDLGRGRVVLLSLALPGRPPVGAATTGYAPPRQVRSVMVEVKRDGVRATSAREEAEQVLGGIDRMRDARRFIPSK